jgi:hypothetical protein
MTRNPGMVYSHGPAATFTKETMRMTRGMDSVRCTGLMAVITKVSGRMGYSTVKVILLLYF